jgi:hypothetical protein
MYKYNNIIMNINKEKIDELINLKNDYNKKISEIDIEINTLIKQRYEKCEHNWVKKRESGQYGELYTVCSKCGKEYEH